MDIDYNEKKYNETFDLIYNSIMRQKENGEISIESLEALLRDQYVHSDLDWIGRGEIKNTIIQATIAAIEAILFDWKAE